MNVFLKNKDYRRLSIANFLSNAGDILFYLAFMTYASKLKNYSLALSLIAISEAIPRLFDIVGGYLADKTYNKFKNIFLMAVVRFILYGLVGILFITNISQWSLVIAVVITTVAQFIGSGLLLFLSYSNLAFVNAFTFLFAGILYASVGLRQKKK